MRSFVRLSHRATTARASQRLKSIMFSREAPYETFSVQLPSKYRRTIVIIAPLMKFGGEVVLTFLSRTSWNVRVVVVTPHFKDIETLRSQLRSSWRKRLIPCECELHSGASIISGVIKLRELLDRVDSVIHLKPLAETVTPQRLKPLLCANDYAVRLFTKELHKYFGPGVDFLLLEHELSESPQFVADRAFEETMQ